MRRSHSWIVSAVLLCLWAADAAADEAKQPNILFLFTDDQRADTIGALGNEQVRTPNLDRLARAGFVFNNAYCMGSTMPAVCLPSRTMMHSGRSLFRIGGVTADSPHLSKSFREAGYETFHVSKRGNVPHALHKAFEHSSYLKDEAERNGGQHGETEAERAIEFLQSRDRSRPFFAYLGFAGPHDPRVAAPEWMSLYQRESIPLPRNFSPFHPFDNGELLVRDERLADWPRTESAIRQHLHDYYACISSIDHQIGRILAALRETGDDRNTIIVFSSDHGLAVGSHGLMGKQNLYEHSMKAPLIIAGPGIESGRSDALLYLHDIYPTLCDLAGVEVPAGLDGKSMAPVIRGAPGAATGSEAAVVRDTIFTVYRDVQRAVRRGGWKLIRYPKINKTQLFDLRSDPDELHDLSADPRYAQRIAELMAALKEQQELSGDPLPLTSANPQPAAVDLSYFAEPGAKP